MTQEQQTKSVAVSAADRTANFLRLLSREITELGGVPAVHLDGALKDQTLIKLFAMLAVGKAKLTKLSSEEILLSDLANVAIKLEALQEVSRFNDLQKIAIDANGKYPKEVRYAAAIKLRDTTKQNSFCCDDLLDVAKKCGTSRREVDLRVAAIMFEGKAEWVTPEHGDPNNPPMYTLGDKKALFAFAREQCGIVQDKIYKAMLKKIKTEWLIELLSSNESPLKDDAMTFALEELQWRQDLGTGLVDILATVELMPRRLQIAEVQLKVISRKLEKEEFFALLEDHLFDASQISHETYGAFALLAWSIFQTYLHGNLEDFKRIMQNCASEAIRSNLFVYWYRQRTMNRSVSVVDPKIQEEISETIMTYGSDTLKRVYANRKDFLMGAIGATPTHKSVMELFV